MKWGIASAFLFFVFAALLLGCGGLLEPPFQLAFGWIWYLSRVLPEVTVNVGACFQGVIALGLLVAVAHGFLRWLSGQMQSKEEGPRRPWRFRWTCCGVSVVILMFVAGISMTAMVHQVHWLASSPGPMFSSGMEAPRRAKSRNNLKQIALGLLNHESAQQQFPADVTFGPYGEMRHGWIAQTLPYMEGPWVAEEIDMDLPWDHPDNAEAFKTPINELLNPRFKDAPFEDDDGYVMTHYMANSRVVGGHKPMAIGDLTDGMSQTILAGEVNHDFKPWGHPLNWRDPARGLGDVRGGFGGPPGSSTTNILMADGSVQSMSNDIDPAVLEALATPASGDQVEWPEDP